MVNETIVVIVRATITFFTLLIYTRMLGKQQMSNLTFFDYINGITIGSIGGGLATDLTMKAWVHWVGLTTFIALTFLMQIITLNSRHWAKIADSEPVLVIRDGQILEKSIRNMRVKKDEIMLLLREKGVFDLTHAAYAFLEPNGQLSVLLKEEYRPVTPKDLHLPVKPIQPMTEVIYEGNILYANLTKLGKDEEWLNEQITQKGASKVSEVSYAAILPNGSFYVDLLNDRSSREKE